MPQVIDMTKQRWGYLTAIRIIGKDSKRNTIWLCRCDCGKEIPVAGYSLRRGDSKSCGCKHLNATSEKDNRRNKKHGMRNTAEYNAWDAMKTRCYNQSAPKYPIYGGRGIKVCQRWIESFENFYADMGPKPSPTHSLDRIDVNGNYEPSNCRWATSTEQNRNRRPYKQRKQDFA